MKTQILFLHALSPLHAGTGQGVGAIDLPIARERATGIPIVPGSSIKGVLRAACQDDQHKVAVFGPDTNNAHIHAGSVQFSDLRLLFLPVRSLAGTFAWVTSPLLLRRFQRDVQWANNGIVPALPPAITEQESCLISQKESVLPFTFDGSQKIVLEDLDLKPTASEIATQWAGFLAPQIFGDATWTTLFSQRICIVHDDVMSFLWETATDVTARIQLEEQTKTVRDGALWYEEALPAESILAGIMVAQPTPAAGIDANKAVEVVKELIKAPLQVGGSATVGRGLCRVHML